MLKQSFDRNLASYEAAKGASINDSTFTGRTLEMLRNVRASLADAQSELDALSERNFGPSPVPEGENPLAYPGGRFGEVEALIADLTERAQALAARARGLNSAV